MTTKATSPASTGPAGPHFEGQVGAYYLLSMLASTEPRGLPGGAIDRIELQRAAEGRPLDDVVVRAHDTHGQSAVLEIQVKRSISFAPGDQIFRKVVAQIVDASRRSDFWNSRYELAIATAHTSRKIEQAYKDVLTWARQVGDAATFMDRIARPGSASDDMRSFVGSFKANLRHAGSRDDDDLVWGLLRRVQILVFDFTARGSESEQLAKERAIRVLHPDDASRAGNLWTALVELSLHVAASGGDRTREEVIGDITQQSFRLAGERRYLSARAVLAEASRNALAEIADRVGGAMLTRHERIAAIHAALQRGRYVEILGDAGVGKSGILKHFAQQMATEARVLVLSPGRTTPGGWTAMRAVLGFDGTARDLLVDLAGDGGAILFVDNLDFFSEDERRTVVDLVREAANVPGFAVVATARHNFGLEETNWLPSDALDRLGRAGPIGIDELSDSEVAEMRHTSPSLAALLADNHPARGVTRNLFRLSRLADRPGEGPVPRTEVDMAEQWWQTADGQRDSHHRERSRLLKALASQLLARDEPLDVTDSPAVAVNALVSSETLRDLGNDRLAFRHDVLREWAISNLLYSDVETIERLPLDRPASAALARGIDLASRMVLERAGDAVRWHSIVERLSRPGVHPSWRRAALLALVRSEISSELLTRVSGLLFANGSSMLRELIRIVMAVDVEPATRIFASMGVEPASIPASLNAPIGPSWGRLIRWLLGVGETLPGTAIPDVADFYSAWSAGMLGHDPLTPFLLQWLHRWLTEIEAGRHGGTGHDARAPLGGELSYERMRSLESDLRTGFLLFCNQTPALAVDYLTSVIHQEHNEDTIRSILKFRGGLAQAAPAELAQLTVTALIPTHQPTEREYRRELREPFSFLDSDFLPASPAQGPFLELLTHAPQHGLLLIQRLVDHAISFHSRGRQAGADAITLTFPEAERAFPWTQSYAWSRDWANHYSVTSGLMALEAWAHRRIEAGETVDDVLADVLGPVGSPAAYLLVAVDLLLSHWPKSRQAAVPFLSCPELLCIDRQRGLHDNIPYPDILGLKALQKEPLGPVNLDSLRNRASRSLTLDQVLGQYAVFGPTELRETLTALLRRAAARLGPSDQASDLGDPSFMAGHALNLVDPTNWPEVVVTCSDGTQKTGRQYQSPPTESRHFAALQASAHHRVAEASMQASLAFALEDSSRSSPEFAARAVEWAKSADASPASEDDGADENGMRREALLTAAMIAMRDSDTELRTRHEAWARGVFVRALQAKEDAIYRFRSGLRFNPVAIAVVGMIHSARNRATSLDIRAVLDVAGGGDPAAAYGFGAAAATLASIDERLPRAVLRCALAACIRSRHSWRGAEEEDATRADERRRHRVQATVDAEVGWLANERPEPAWPVFPSEPARPRHRLRFSRTRTQDDDAVPQPTPPSDYIDHQAAAVWLSQARVLGDVGVQPWLRDIAWSYVHWTAEANGAGLDVHEQIADPPRE